MDGRNALRSDMASPNRQAIESYEARIVAYRAGPRVTRGPDALTTDRAIRRPGISPSTR